MSERLPFLLIMVAGLVALPLYYQRYKRRQAAFFDPAIEQAERALAAFAQSTQSTFRPSTRRWSQLVGWLGFRLSTKDINRSRYKAFTSSGGVDLVFAGYPVRVGWVVVGLDSGFALLPRIKLSLPPGWSLRGLHQRPRFLVDYWYLWSKDLHGVTDKRPLIQLTSLELPAFTALAARSCLIRMQASSPIDPLTGALPDPYALDLHVWGAPLHGESSPAPLERHIFGWRDDFRREDLQELIELAARLARTATTRELAGAADPAGEPERLVPLARKD